MSRNARKGIVLILASGLLTAIALLGALFLRVSRFSASVEDARRQQILASLAAESGLSYAAGRLSNEIGYLPSGALTENRGDDWTFRDGLETPLPDAANVSYGHGEAWRETGGDPGAYDAGLDDVSSAGAWTDLDGDGKFSAWSGRLRGEGGGHFALKIVSPGGLFPVNAPDVSGELARLGDNLGAILLSSADPNAAAIQRVDRAYTAPSGETGEAIRISALGRHLLYGEDLNWNSVPAEDANGNGILDTEDTNGNGQLDFGEDLNLNGQLDTEDANGNGVLDPAGGRGVLDPGEDLNGNGVLDRGRPSGGFRSLEEIEVFLSSFGYTASQVEAVIPFMDIGPYEPSGARIELATAPREILEALWTYASFCPSEDTLLLGQGMSDWLNLPYGSAGARSGGGVRYTGLPDTLLGNWSGNAGGGAVTGSSMGSFGNFGLGNNSGGSSGGNSGGGQGAAKGASVMIYPDEARRIVDWAVEFRREAPRCASWLSFRRELCAWAAPPASRFFQDDLDPLLANGWTEAAWGWARAKADAAFYAVCREDFSDWGIDHGPGLPPEGVARPFIGLDGRTAGFPFPVPADPVSGSAWAFSPYLGVINGGPPSLSLTLAPPTQYLVSSVARLGHAQAEAAGRLRVFERLEFTGQEDFEALSGGWQLAARGITVIDLADRADRRRTVSDSVENLAEALSPFSPPVPLRGAVTGPSFNPGGTTGSFPSQDWGSIGLAGKYTGHQWAYLYGPFHPDDVAQATAQEEEEWKLETRGTAPWPAVPPNPPLYGSFKKASSFPSTVSGSTWSVRVDNSVKMNANACSGMDFPPLTCGATDEAMKDFSVEFWAAGIGTVFDLAADAVLPNVNNNNNNSKKKNDIVFKLTRVPEWGGAGVPGMRYTVDFKAPTNAKITVEDDDPGDTESPPTEQELNYYGYLISLDAFVPNVSVGSAATAADNRVAGQDHVVVTLENTEVSEDANGNGQLDPGEDANGDGVLGPRKDLVVSLYVNGLLAASKKDSQAISENVPARFLTQGRAYPSHPYSTTRDTALKEMRQLGFIGDEVRFYDEVRRADGTADVVLRGPDVTARYGLGRFFLPPGASGSAANPAFVSPAYDLGAPARILCAGWTGIPAGDPSGSERVGMTVTVGTSKVPQGTPEVNGVALEDPTELTAAAFEGMEPVRSLGYSVEFYSLDPADASPLYATPLFDGIWLHIQRPGRSPAWIARD